MINEDMEPGDIERRVHDLAKAMNEIRASQADHDDVVVELKHAKLSRLELLVDDLKPVIDDIPKDNEQFEFAVTRGNSPRLWVDMTSFVRLAGEGREYEFVKDTRMGRVVLLRDASRARMGEFITKYIAERLLERERMIEGDWVSMSHMMDAIRNTETGNGHSKPDSQSVMSKERSFADRNDKSSKAISSSGLVNETRHSTLSLFVWFLLGLLGGGMILFALTWFGLMEQIVEMVN